MKLRAKHARYDEMVYIKKILPQTLLDRCTDVVKFLVKDASPALHKTCPWSKDCRFFAIQVDDGWYEIDYVGVGTPSYYDGFEHAEEHSLRIVNDYGMPNNVDEVEIEFSDHTVDCLCHYFESKAPNPEDSWEIVSENEDHE